MKDPTEAPPRYADTGAPEGRLLDLLRAPEMSAEQIARGERRIAEVAKAPRPPTPTGIGPLKIAALVALVVAPLATYGLTTARDEARPHDRPGLAAPIEETDAPAAPARAPTEAAPAIGVDSLPTAPTVIESTPSAPKLVDARKAAPPRAPNDRLAAELALLDHARIALGTDPEAALRDVGRHARDFPDGQLVAQREVIAVDALQRLGRTSEARARGKAFQGRGPDTSAARRIDSLLNGPPAAARP